MAICKHPEEVCGNMTLYRGKTYCDNLNGFCSLHDELPLLTNADRIRAMSDEELSAWMAECNAYGERADASQWLPWLKRPAEVDNG